MNQPMRIALLVMPVVNVDRPSIAVTKLRDALKRAHGDRVSTEIHYASHDFAVHVARGRRVSGRDLHDVLLDHQHVGLPDWIFRREAFPDTEDTANRYFRRYFPGRSPEVQELRDVLLEQRESLGDFLEDLIDRYRLDQAQVVGFTSLFLQCGSVFALARRIKARNPAVTIVMGGSNCDTPMGEEYARNVPALDYVFSGPALISFPAFIGHLLDGEPERAARIQGVFSRDTLERPREERAGEELDINAPCDLDYADFFRSLDSHFPGAALRPQVHLETSRGCWWGEKSHCTFCGLNADGMNYRAMDAERAVELFRDMIARYRSRAAIFLTLDNIMPRNYVKDVLPRIHAPPGTRLFYEVKASLTADEMRIMADAGVRWLQPGIEALSSHSLKLMRKGTTSFINLRMLKNCVRYGIDPIWNILVGFPGEGAAVYAQYVKDIPLITHLRPPQGVATIHFDRFSPYHMRPEEYGLKLKPVDYYAMCFPFPQESITNLAYFFTDTNYDAPHVTDLLTWLRPLEELVRDWHRRWHVAGRDFWEERDPLADVPRLELRHGPRGVRVFDSRGETPREVELDEAQHRLLDYLDFERTAAAVQEFCRAGGIDAEAQLAFLDEHRLLWREGEKLFSLVMAGSGVPAAAAPVGAGIGAS
jgi:magnesium-protoporphyrin IX monomethyl ester (oxidative) cyclase